MADIKILLVDDHQLIRAGIKSIIETSNNIIVVEECKNGNEAIEYLRTKSRKIDVVLMDITMHEMNGIEATEIITSRFPAINILALTMHSEEAYILKMVKAGAMGYILKDSSREKLIEAIQTVNRKEKYYSNEVSIKLINVLINEKKETEPFLSDRELEILSSITDGFTNKEIAKELYISDRTVESHRRNIIKKLNLKNTADLVRYAIQEGIVGKT